MVRVCWHELRWTWWVLWYAVQSLRCVCVAVDSFEVQEVALHTGEWKETVYSVSADVLDGVSVCVCVCSYHTVFPKHTKILPKAHYMSPCTTQTVFPKHSNHLPKEYFLSPSTTLPVSPRHTVSPYHSVCVCVVCFLFYVVDCLSD